MKKLLRIFVLLILLVPFSVGAKEVNIKGNIWGGYYGEHLFNVIETNDSYIAVGNGLTDDIYGNPVNGSEDMRINFYDKDSLEITSQITYGGSCYENGTAILENSNGEIIVIGQTCSDDIDGLENNGSYDALMLKFNEKRNLISQQSWGGSSHDSFSTIKTTYDGYIVVGYTESQNIEGINNQGGRDALIIKFDYYGNVIWQKNYGGNSSDGFYDVVVTKDGYIAVGYSYSSNIVNNGGKYISDALIVKYDLDGNIVWQKVYGGSQSDSFNSLVKLDDNSIIAVGESSSTDIPEIINKGSSDGIIVKYDQNGNIIWQKNYGGSGNEYINKIKLTSSNELVISGSTMSTDIIGIENKGAGDASIIKLDLDGNILEFITIGGCSWENLNSIIETKNGYVAVGYSSSNDIPNMPYAGGYGGAFIVDVSYKYDLQKETDTIKNGTYDIKQVGQRAEISINPNNGYVLDKIIVKDASGNELTYYEENGKYYVDLTNDIVVDVKYKQKSILNPNTGGLLMILEVLTLIAIFTYSFMGVNKKKQIN